LLSGFGHWWQGNMSRGLQILAVAWLAGAMLALGPSQAVRAATSPTPDILSDDRSPDVVDVGSVKPLARPKAEPARVLPSGNPLWAVPLSALTATQARPIFSASRRPPQPAVVAPAPVLASAPPPPTEAEHPPLALIGAVVGAGEAIAVFLDRATQKIVRLRPGESHGGWKLSGVESREVTFKKDDRSETLVLQRRDGATETPAASAPAGEPGVPAIPVAGAVDGSYAPFVPKHTPKNGESDGL
jgi:general secretion pathway protein N